jgi:hypothetical protein
MTKGSGHKAKAKESAAAGTCFVIQPATVWFAAVWREVYEPAIAEAGLRPERVGSERLALPVIDKLWRGLQRAKVVVADVSAPTPGVYYAVGLAHALGKPVVVTSRRIDDSPFDTRNLFHVDYDVEDPAWGVRLRTRLAAALRDVLKSPAVAVPSVFQRAVPSQAPEITEAGKREVELREIIRGLAARVASLQAERASADLDATRESAAWAPHRAKPAANVPADALSGGGERRA